MFDLLETLGLDPPSPLEEAEHLRGGSGPTPPKRILFCPCQIVQKGLAKLILLNIGDIAIDVKGELSKEELKRYILSTKDL